MPNVTVLGAGGATVTIALSSAQNALAAQTAAGSINKLNQFGILDQQTWSGKGTLPAPSNVLGGAIIGGLTNGIAGDAGGLTPQYVSVLVNATGNSTVIGPQNANSTVIGGDSSNLTYGNLSQTGSIFFGDGSDVLVNFAGTANVIAGSGTYIAFTDKSASTNISAGSGAVILTSDLLGGSGKNVVNAAAGGNTTVIASGASTVPVTVNASNGNLFVVSHNAGSAVINPGTAHVTVVGNATDLGGRVTLFGGSSSVIVADGQGEFTGGTSGKNVMFSSTVAGSATLTGGGNGDLLVGRGTGQLLIAGAGNETLYARTSEIGGNSFIVGNGFSTVFGGGQGGNTYIFSGLGSAEIDGRDESAAGASTQNTYFNFDTDGNNATGGTYFIADFVSGTDKLLISKADTATVTFFAPNASGSPLGSIGGTQVVVSSGTTYNFFDTVANPGQDIFASDIQKV